jgi:CheY-like chemotaxis protein
MSPWLRPAVAPARTDVTPVLSMGADGLRRHVLLAEDNPVNQPVARGLLARLGCDVDVAANGSGAVRLFVPARYDLVLMDCMMPGWTATRRLSKFGGSPAGG